MSKGRVRLFPAVGLAAAAAPSIAATAEIKYVLQCGNAKSVPPDDDSDPVLLTRIVAIRNGESQNGEVYIRHFVASGENYTRNKQYRDLRFWSEGRPTIGQAPQSSFRIERWSAGSGYTADANG